MIRKCYVPIGRQINCLGWFFNRFTYKKKLAESSSLRNDRVINKQTKRQLSEA